MTIYRQWPRTFQNIWQHALVAVCKNVLYYVRLVEVEASGIDEGIADIAALLEIVNTENMSNRPWRRKFWFLHAPSNHLPFETILRVWSLEIPGRWIRILSLIEGYDHRPSDAMQLLIFCKSPITFLCAPATHFSLNQAQKRHTFESSHHSPTITSSTFVSPLSASLPWGVFGLMILELMKGWSKRSLF